MGKIVYRAARIEDAVAISELILTSQGEFNFHEFTEEGKAVMRRACSAAAIHEYLTRGDVYFVALHAEEVIGVAGVRELNHLTHNFVATAWHRQGISNQLWRLAAEACMARGNPGRFTLRSSTFAIPVYERWGFVRTGPQEDTAGVVSTPMMLDMTAPSR